MAKRKKAPISPVLVGSVALVGVGLFLTMTPREPLLPGPKSHEQAAQAIHAKYPKASLPLARAIVAAAVAVGAHPFDLANLIHFESGGTFSPTIENIRCAKRNGPGSGKCAVGLIQFMPATAASLFGMTKGPQGYTAAQKLEAYRRMSHLSAIEQTRYIKQYLRPFRPLNTPYKLAMAVFYPVAIKKSPDWRFPSIVTRHNPGVTTPRDYTDRKFARARLPRSDQLAPA